jgi:hypothetical protein
MTRLQPRAAVLVMGTRWHEGDLIGRILSSSSAAEWEVLSLPAVAEEDDPLGRDEGQPLWPDWFDADYLARLREQLGERAFASLYQQRPTPAVGAVFPGHGSTGATGSCRTGCGSWRRSTRASRRARLRTTARSSREGGGVEGGASRGCVAALRGGAGAVSRNGTELARPRSWRSWWVSRPGGTTTWSTRSCTRSRASGVTAARALVQRSRASRSWGSGSDSGTAAGSPPIRSPEGRFGTRGRSAGCLLAHAAYASLRGRGECPELGRDEVQLRDLVRAQRSARSSIKVKRRCDRSSTRGSPMLAPESHEHSPGRVRVRRDLTSV